MKQQHLSVNGVCPQGLLVEELSELKSLLEPWMVKAREVRASMNQITAAAETLSKVLGSVTSTYLLAKGYPIDVTVDLNTGAMVKNEAPKP